MFSEADEVDVSDPELSFVFGRRSEPVQPQIPRFRAAASKASTFVAILASQEQVHCLLHTADMCTNYGLRFSFKLLAQEHSSP